MCNAQYCVYGILRTQKTDRAAYKQHNGLFSLSVDQGGWNQGLTDTSYFMAWNSDSKGSWTWHHNKKQRLVVASNMIHCGKGKNKQANKKGPQTLWPVNYKYLLGHSVNVNIFKRKSYTATVTKDRIKLEYSPFIQYLV